MTETSDTYQVLARKYRPQMFADLIGQDHMVRVLKNSFEHDRIHHAFILTGVRGVGKTTTARIIAKGLNCTASDRPTIAPCGKCEACTKITASTHVDVYEMDAASRTGVNDVREIIEAVRYRATSARYKVYIIDEVHMLSTQAFNALLKTLEEPPEHTKFIFATTDIHKVPVTVLSRCQRFDLKRVDQVTLQKHLAHIVTQEGANISPEALELVANAGDGSVRDALSLLDQVVSQALQEDTKKSLDAQTVRTMIGLADRSQTIDLFEAIMEGKTPKALESLRVQYMHGADPIAILRDLAEIAHTLSLHKVVPATQADRLQQMAQKLSIRALNQCWQILLKALSSVDTAPSAIMAAEMTVIQLTHAANLPGPDTLMRLVQDAPQVTVPQAGRAVTSFSEMLELIREKQDIKLEMDVKHCMRVMDFEDGKIIFTPTENAPRDLRLILAQKLSEWTQKKWNILTVDDCTAPTYEEQQAVDYETLEDKVKAHPLIQKTLAVFPGAKVSSIR